MSKAASRASVLLAVVLIVAIAAVAGTTAMYLARAEVSATRQSLLRIQSRALAWSGVQAALAELSDRREALLDGEAPALTGEWEFSAEGDAVRNVVRLVSWDESGALVRSEPARIDVNNAMREMLVAAGLDESAAAAIVAVRQKHRLMSERDILRIAGVEVESAEPRDQSAHQGGGGWMEEDPGDLLGRFTVFSFDPEVQSGLGDNASAHRGKRRLNLNTPWSDRLGAALEERFGEGSSRAIKPFFDRGEEFTSVSKIVGVLRRVNVAPEQWPPILDALATIEDPYSLGRIDLNQATEEILACIPGLSTETAAAIVAARDRVDRAARRSIAWPVIEGIVKPEEFEKCADFLTTRSLQWRIRVEAGRLNVPEGESADLREGTLTDRVILEAVLDVSSERPRVAYLREISMLPAMRAVLADMPEDADGGQRDAEAAGDARRVRGTVGGVADDLELDEGFTSGSADLNLGGRSRSEASPSGGAVPISAPSASGSGSGSGEGVDRRIGRWAAPVGGKEATP